jgi:hypothetical protein
MPAIGYNHIGPQQSTALNESIHPSILALVHASLGYTALPVAPTTHTYLAIAFDSNADVPRSACVAHGTFPNGFFSFKYSADLFVTPISQGMLFNALSAVPAHRAAAEMRKFRVVPP